MVCGKECHVRFCRADAGHLGSEPFFGQNRAGGVAASDQRLGVATINFGLLEIAFLGRYLLILGNILMLGLYGLVPHRLGSSCNHRCWLGAL